MSKTRPPSPPHSPPKPPALPAHVTAQAAAESARAAKDGARVAYISVLRALVKRLQASASVSDAERASLGITIPDPGSAPIGPLVHRLETCATGS